MVDEKDKKAPAKAAAPKPAAKAPAAKPAAKAVPVKTETAKAAPVTAKAPEKAKAEKPAKKVPTGPTVTVTQIGSPIGRPEYQRDTLKGLGLNKLHRTRTLTDTPSVRGMIERVKHLLRVG